MNPKKIAILGSTGSIGTQALDIVRQNKEMYKATVLSCNQNISLLKEQIREFAPEVVVTGKSEDAQSLEREFPGIHFLWGGEGLREAAAWGDYDLLLNSLVGMRGLVPTYAALCEKRQVALANKETLVAGGELVMKKAREQGVEILPVDSEHSAIFQSLEGNRQNPYKRIILTASGGPFRNYTKEMLAHVSLEDALRHPNWSMGRKITVDSASMMNKGLEVIEAHHLFDAPAEKISVWIHPQSIIHSMVEYQDRCVIAQLGLPDMRMPIAYAFSYPRRLPFLSGESLDLAAIGSLTFEEPDMQRFPCLQMAYDALKEGGDAPCALNAANEELVGLFLQKRIEFMDIPRGLDHIMQKHHTRKISCLEDILETDRQIRRLVKKA